MSTVTITRAETGFSNRNARFKVLLDGAEVAKLGSNQHLDLDVAPGRHALAIKQNWTTAQTEFTIDDGQHLKFHLRLNQWGDVMALLRPSKYIEIVPG